MKEYEKAYESTPGCDLKDAIRMISQNMYKQIFLVPKGTKMTMDAFEMNMSLIFTMPKEIFSSVPAPPSI